MDINKINRKILMIDKQKKSLEKSLYIQGVSTSLLALSGLFICLNIDNVIQFTNLFLTAENSIDSKLHDIHYSIAEAQVFSFSLMTFLTSYIPKKMIKTENELHVFLLMSLGFICVFILGHNNGLYYFSKELLNSFSLDSAIEYVLIFSFFSYSTCYFINQCLEVYYNRKRFFFEHKKLNKIEAEYLSTNLKHCSNINLLFEKTSYGLLRKRVEKFEKLNIEKNMEKFIKNKYKEKQHNVIIND